MTPEEVRKSHTCIAFHIQAFQRQAEDNEQADITEPCKICPYGKECDFAWNRYILRVIPESRYHITLAKGCAYLPEDINL